MIYTVIHYYYLNVAISCMTYLKLKDPNTLPFWNFLFFWIVIKCSFYRLCIWPMIRGMCHFVVLLLMDCRALVYDSFCLYVKYLYVLLILGFFINLSHCAKTVIIWHFAYAEMVHPFNINRWLWLFEGGVGLRFVQFYTILF